MSAAQPTYRIGEFARLAGVTVRALHHYDRLGLLCPKRGVGGYRVYTIRDLELLEQIVVLKFVGIPLRRIADLLRASPRLLVTHLRAQRGTLERSGSSSIVRLPPSEISRPPSWPVLAPGHTCTSELSR